jgi:hypothetical protein
VRILDTNAKMSELVEYAQGTIRQGTLPVSATSELIEYEFTLNVNRRRVPLVPWPSERVDGRFALWDGPGGALFPSLQVGPNVDTASFKHLRAQLVDALKSAEGLMLCLDSTDATRSLEMFETLPGIMRDTGLPVLPCKRLCVCLTKADKHFADKGTGARAAAEDTSAQAACRAILPGIIFRVLAKFCADARFGFSWTSVYGFLPSGAPNYESAGGGRLSQWNLIDAGAKQTIEQWEPFRVLDPFIWLATGRARDLEVFAASELPDVFAPDA